MKLRVKASIEEASSYANDFKARVALFGQEFPEDEYGKAVGELFGDSHTAGSSLSPTGSLHDGATISSRSTITGTVDSHVSRDLSTGSGSMEIDDEDDQHPLQLQINVSPF